MSHPCTRAVILAAGTSSRAGTQKLLLPLGNRPLIEYPIAAAQRWKPIVVCAPEVAAYLRGRSDVCLVLNDEPERGMSHSLRLGNRAVGDADTILVLLGDKPLVCSGLIETICLFERDVDVVYPERAGEPGHPVRLSPRARSGIERLPCGDTLRLLRDRGELRSRGMPCDDEGAFFDVDTVEALEPLR